MRQSPITEPEGMRMSRAVVVKSLGGPEVLHVDEVAEPHAGPGQVRVRVTAAGLNPMDWLIVSDENLAAAFGVRPPAGFGFDFAAEAVRPATGNTPAMTSSTPSGVGRTSSRDGSITT